MALNKLHFYVNEKKNRGNVSASIPKIVETWQNIIFIKLVCDLEDEFRHANSKDIFSCTKMGHVWVTEFIFVPNARIPTMILFFSILIKFQ